MRFSSGLCRCGGARSARGDFAEAALGWVLLTVFRMPPLVVVAIGALGGFALATPHT